MQSFSVSINHLKKFARNLFDRDSEAVVSPWHRDWTATVIVFGVCVLIIAAAHFLVFKKFTAVSLPQSGTDRRIVSEKQLGEAVLYVDERAQALIDVRASRPAVVDPSL